MWERACDICQSHKVDTVCHYFLMKKEKKYWILCPLAFHRAIEREKYINWKTSLHIYIMLMCPGLVLCLSQSSPSDFWWWNVKNNTRSCVPTCLPEYSAIMANSRILQPLQPAAALLPSGSFSLFNTISRRGFRPFCITQVHEQRAIISILLFLSTKSQTEI